MKILWVFFGLFVIYQILFHYNKKFRNKVEDYSNLIWGFWIGVLSLAQFLLGLAGQITGWFNYELSSNGENLVTAIFISISFLLFINERIKSGKESKSNQEMIDILLLEKQAEKGFRDSVAELRNFVNHKKCLNEYAHSYAMNVKDSVNSKLQGFIQKPFGYLIMTEKDKPLKWSLESLSNHLRTNYGHNVTTIHGAIGQIVHQKETRLIPQLMNLVNTHYQLEVSCYALKAVGELTDYEAYDGQQFHRKKLITSDYDFRRIRQWWNQEGKPKYDNNLVDEGVLIDSKNSSINEYRKDQEKEVIKKYEDFLIRYPDAGLTLGKLAYLMIDKDNDKAEELALKSIDNSESEPTQFIVIAYLCAIKNEIPEGEKYLRRALTVLDSKEFATTFYYSPKVRDVVDRAYDKVLKELLDPFMTRN